MRVLFLSRWYPYPPNNGSKLRIYHLLKGLAVENDVTLISLSNNPDSDRLDRQLGKICKKLFIIPYQEYRPRSIRSFIGLVSPMPRSLYDTYSPMMANKISTVASKDEFDVVIASQIGTAMYHKSFKGIPAIFEEVEVGGFYSRNKNENSAIRKMRTGLTWRKNRQYISELTKAFSVCTVVSEQERSILHETLQLIEHIEVIPNFINLDDFSLDIPKTNDHSLIFTGPFRYHANYQAMLWFLEHVYPRVQEKIPNVSLTITGDHNNLPIPTTGGVRLSGMLPDIRPLVAGSTISIAPIMYGGGTRLKILEAMALKTPVVSTTKGAEGINVTDCENIFLADDPGHFANVIIQLFKEPETRERIADNAYQLVLDNYDWQVVMPEFINLVDRVSSKSKNQSY